MYSMRLSSILIVFIFSISITTLSILCDARSFAQLLKSQDTKLHERNSIHELEKKPEAVNHLELDLPLPSPSTEPIHVSPPFALSPFGSLSPLPLPGNVPPPPYSVYPPFTPQPPSRAPTYSPTPNPPQNGPSPHPSPHTTIPSPPKHSPTPPIVYPPHKKPPQSAVWCVAKPSVPDPIVQEAMDYACGSGADCKSIQPNGSCFQPDTLLSHASYAFNSCWQNTKVAGGTCDFGGTAMLVAVDPSFDGCPFFYNG